LVQLLRYKKEQDDDDDEEPENGSGSANKEEEAAAAAVDSSLIMKTMTTTDVLKSIFSPRGPPGSDVLRPSLRPIVASTLLPGYIARVSPTADHTFTVTLLGANQSLFCGGAADQSADPDDKCVVIYCSTAPSSPCSCWLVDHYHG
jgi:hypothetical protein